MCREVQIRLKKETFDFISQDCRTICEVLVRIRVRGSRTVVSLRDFGPGQRSRASSLDSFCPMQRPTCNQRIDRLTERPSTSSVTNELLLRRDLRIIDPRFTFALGHTRDSTTPFVMETRVMFSQK